MRVWRIAICRTTQVSVANQNNCNSLLTPVTEDQRSIANRLAREEKRYKEPEEQDLEKIRADQDATLPAKAHGNKPSRGAEIDQELHEEEEQILKKKGAFGPK